MDYHLNDKNSFNLNYFWGTFVDAPSSEVAQQSLTTQTACSNVISGSRMYVASPTVVNSLRIGDSRYIQKFGTPDQSQQASNYKFNGITYNFYTGQTDPYFGGFPRIPN